MKNIRLDVLITVNKLNVLFLQLFIRIQLLDTFSIKWQDSVIQFAIPKFLIVLNAVGVLMIIKIIIAEHGYNIAVIPLCKISVNGVTILLHVFYIKIIKLYFPWETKWRYEPENSSRK